MHSRAHLLIERDGERLEKDKPWGIEASPLVDDNLFEWTARIEGLKSTIWEGGVFRLYLKFSEHYNAVPPEVCFHTIPFHPNVDMITGKPCIDFLDDLDKWKEGYTITTVLLSIQSMLCNPVLVNAVNIEAVEMMLNSPLAYKQIVLDCVAASQRVEAGLLPHAESKVRFGPMPEEPPKREIPRTVPQKASKLSFEDYHKTWSGIATSKPFTEAPNSFLDEVQETPGLTKTHIGIDSAELKEQAKRQVEEHRELMYGRFRKRGEEDISSDARLEHVQRMRKIYLPKRTPAVTPSNSPCGVEDEANYLEGFPRGNDMFVNMDSGSPDLPPVLRQENTFQEEEDSWEQEVDDLVAWTAKLNEDNL